MTTYEKACLRIERDRAYKEQVRERFRALPTEERAKHWQRIRQYQTPVNRRIGSVRRRAAHAKAKGTLTVQDWQAIQAMYRHRCAYCGKRCADLTIEHVIPLSKGGEHGPRNIVPACMACNLSKGRSLPRVPVQLHL